MSFRSRMRSITKALSVTHPGNSNTFWHFLPRATAEMYRAVGDGTSSSVVMAPLEWLCRTFPEAPLAVDKRGADDWEAQDGHELEQLIARPNPFFSGNTLWWATLLSLVASGNGYWIKLTTRAREVVELWWAPTWTMEPRWPNTGSEFISHYEYNVGKGEPVILPVEDVVHFRWGVDPENIRKGRSPLYSVLREIFSDQEAAVFASSLLKNMGVPGLIISPDGDQIVSDEDMEATEKQVAERFTGNNRGKPLVAGAPTKVQQFGFSPQQLDLRQLRRLPEERVSAVLGIPAIVAGLGAGLDRSTFANMSEAREMAYESCIIPLQRTIAADLKNQLLPDFEGEDLTNWRCRFDLSEVRVLQEDENRIVERKLQELQAGAITRAVYLRETGRQPEPSDDVFLYPFNIVEVPRTGQVDSVLTQGSQAADATQGSQRDEENPSQGDGEEPQTRSRTLKAPTVEQRALMQAFLANERKLAPIFADEIEGELEKLGEECARAYLQLAAHEDDIQLKTDEGIVARILSRVTINRWGAIHLTRAYETHYERVAEVAVDTVNRVMDLGVNLPDEKMRGIVREGGKRVGLVDIVQGTKTALFRALAEARELGEGAAATARRIRSMVPAGRWTNAGPRYRSLLIARTETKYAQNVSAMTAYRESPNVRALLAFDSQGGGETDDECLSRDGTEFTFDDADVELASEHPNGTLSFAPVI